MWFSYNGRFVNLDFLVPCDQNIVRHFNFVKKFLIKTKSIPFRYTYIQTTTFFWSHLVSFHFLYYFIYLYKKPKSKLIILNLQMMLKKYATLFSSFFLLFLMMHNGYSSSFFSSIPQISAFSLVLAIFTFVNLCYLNLLSFDIFFS